MRHRYPENIKVLAAAAAAAAEYKVTVLEKNRGEYPDFELGVVLDLVLVLASQLTPQCIEKRQRSLEREAVGPRGSGVLFQNEDSRMPRETEQGLGKLEVGEGLPSSSSWAPPA